MWWWYLASGGIVLWRQCLKHRVDLKATTVVWRPWLLPRGIVRAGHAVDAPTCWLYVVLVLMSPLTCSTAYRVVFAIATLIMHLNYYTRLPETKRMFFVHTYFALGLVGTAGPREGALRMIVAHQLGSAGIAKLKIAGFKDWTDGRSMQKWMLRYCGASKLHPLHSATLTKYLLISPALCRALNAASLLFELAWPLLVLTASASTLVVLMCSGIAFHIGVVVASGIAFYSNVLAYALLASLADPAYSYADLYCNPACAIILVCAAYALWTSMDDWPLNEMAVFPFSHRQIDQIDKFYDTFYLARADKNTGATTKGPDLVKMCFFSVPTVTIEPARFVLIAAYDNDEARRAALARWVKRTCLWIEPKSFEFYNDVLLDPKHNKKHDDTPLGAVRGYGTLAD